MASTDLVIQAPDIDTPQIKQLARLAEADTVTALAAAGTQAFRLSPARQRAGVAELCAVAGIDFGFVPDDHMRGIKPQIAAITESAMRGEIDFRESLKRRVALLAGLDMAALARVYDERLKLSPGAERMLAGFARVGAKTLLVSGGFTFFTDRLKARLGLDHAVASTLDIADGRLTGRISGEIVDGETKAAAFARLGRELKGDNGLIVAIGDGANDLPLLRLADVSVAYHAKPIVRAETTYAIDYCGLDAVLKLFQ